MKNVIFIFILCISVVACAPKAQHSPKATDGFADFGPTTEDSVVEINKSATFDSLYPTSKLTDSAADIFRFADEVLDYSNAQAGNVALKKFAHNLLAMFYSTPDTTTHFEPENSAYLQAAMAFEGENIYKYVKSLSSEDTGKRIEAVIENEKLPWPASVTLEPKVFIVAIKNYLNLLPAKMSQNGVSAPIVESFDVAMKRDFIPSLDEAQQHLEDVGPKAPLKENLVAIKNAVTKLTVLPVTLRADIQKQLQEAESYQKLISRTDSSASKADDMVQVVTRIWLRLAPEDRVKYIRGINQKLYEVLVEATPQQLQYFAGFTRECKSGETAANCYDPGIRDNLYRQGLDKGFKNSCFDKVTQALNEWLFKYNEYGRMQVFRNKYPDIYQLFTEPVGGKQLSDEDLKGYVGSLGGYPILRSEESLAFERRTQNLCISGIANSVVQSINEFLLRKLDSVIRAQDQNLQKVVLGSVKKNLENLRKSVGQISDFGQYFDKLAIPELKRVMFTDIESLPAIERKDVSLNLIDRRLTIKPIVGTTFITGAEVLGASMSANSKRFEGLSKIEGKDPKTKEYWRVVFAEINKMLAVLGFRKMDNTMFQSLHRPIFGALSELDVYKYDCNPTLLDKQEKLKTESKSMPTADNRITRLEDCNGYTQFSDSYFAIPDTLVIESGFTPVDAGTPNVSVAGQAEVLKGASGMLSYFKDWEKTEDDYDVGLGQLDYRGFRLLPKQAFVNLSFGIMSVALRNLRRTQTQLRMFDQWGQEIKDWMKSNDPRSLRISAALSNLSADGRSQIIRSSDLARFIIAIDEFAKSTDGIEGTKASVINPPDKKERINLKALIAGKKQVLVMMVGLQNFLVSKFQDKDGGFWHTYSLDKNQLIDTETPRKLEDQALIQNALLRTYARWGGQGAKWAAIDSVHFSNTKLWNGKIGFYNATESGGQVNPYVFVLTLRNLRNVIPLFKSEKSRDQAKRVLEFWDSKFIEWAIDQDKIGPRP